ncbi:MAG: YezD family protein [Oscillospiraceae bacterium]|nr:YezD family protein [Oscillospiraceae bacterium]
MNDDANNKRTTANLNHNDTVKPSEAEIKVFQLIRTLEYGEIRIVMKNSMVVQIEEKRSIKL